MAMLERLGAEAFIHCGDIGGAEVLDALGGRRVWFVWGNTDHAEVNLERYAESVGIHRPVAVPVVVKIDGVVFQVFHGHETQFTRIADAVGRDVAELRVLLPGVDYVAFGHTHEALHFEVGGVQFVNPGALHRAVTYSVATVDTESREVEHWVVRDDTGALDAPRRMRVPGR